MCVCEKSRVRSFHRGGSSTLLTGGTFPRALCERFPLYQQTTAPKTFLAAAADAAHRAFAGAAVAIKDAFLDAPAERMRLGLEHLRRVRKPQAPPVPPAPTYSRCVSRTSSTRVRGPDALPRDCEKIAPS